MNDEIHYIYGLCDPNTDNIRYVGKSRNIRRRLWGHFNKARNKKYKSRKDKWINSIAERKENPKVIILEECNDDTWEDAERWWIKNLREHGVDLLNVRQGGEGGIKWTEDMKARVSEFHKNRYRSPEEIRATTERAKQMSLDPDIIRRRSSKLIGRKHSPERGIKISNALRGQKRSEEFREKCRKRQTGVRMSEENKERLRKDTIFRNPEFIEKMKASLKGRVFTEEWKKKLSISARKYHRSKKNNGK